jgi:hypothetical protein
MGAPRFAAPRPQPPFFNQGARMGAPRFAAPQQYGQVDGLSLLMRRKLILAQFPPQQVGGPRGPRLNYPRQQQQVLFTTLVLFLPLT